MNQAEKSIRIDIQALRGLAVLMVVLYHTKVTSVQSGYLGVDIFFVISGFLITTLVARGVLRGTFRLSDFYFRRAKRLLPAAYVTFIGCSLCAPWFLNQQELRDFAVQVAGAVSFTGNVVLWQQTGYFEGAGDLKPLLHVWSLALEEQYYFLLPAALLFTRPQRWFAGVVGVLVLSLTLCLVGGYVKPVATFYLLPTRAWELLVGSLGALWLLRGQTAPQAFISRWTGVLFGPALLCLLVLPFVAVVGNHPGLNAVLICLATLVVILRHSSTLCAAWPTRWLAWVGDFSYSLYLVHWPVISFMKNAWVGGSQELPLEMRWLALVLSFALAYLLYRVVEKPVHKSRLQFTRALLAKVVLSSATLMAITPVMIQAKPTKMDFVQIRKTNYGLSDRCDSDVPFAPKPECQSGPDPTLLVWGDSYAMHLVPGLLQEWQSGGVIQATRSSCGPFLKLAPRRLIHPGHGTAMNMDWAKRCIQFNDSVLDFLGHATSVHTVVLSSPFLAYVTQENHEHVTQQGQGFTSMPVQADAAQRGLQRTVQAIRALGKKVIIVAPPPSTDFDIGGCLERQINGAIALGGSAGCLINRADYQTQRANVLTLLDRVATSADVSVIRFDPYLCQGQVCQTLMGNTLIYRDGGHLSIAGSELLAKTMRWGELINHQAK